MKHMDNLIEKIEDLDKEEQKLKEESLKRQKENYYANKQFVENFVESINDMREVTTKLDRTIEIESLYGFGKNRKNFVISFIFDGIIEIKFFKDNRKIVFYRDEEFDFEDEQLERMIEPIKIVQKNMPKIRRKFYKKAKKLIKSKQKDLENYK